MATNFAEYSGRQVRVIDPRAMGPLFMRVLQDGEVSEDSMDDFVANVHPQGALEAGYRVVAIEGDVEDGEVEAGGFIALNASEDRAYLCDSGTIRFFEGPASAIRIEPND